MESSRGEPAAFDSRRIHSGRVIAVDEDTVRFPDGSTGVLDIVRHPGASAVVPFLDDPAGENPTILLIRQYRHAAGKWLMEIPAGRLEPNEDPVSCAQRELIEETGCTAGSISHLTTILTTPGFSDERIHLYMATDLVRGDPRHEVDEFIEPVPTPLAEALSLIESGEIADAKTAIALLYSAGFRAGR